MMNAKARSRLVVGLFAAGLLTVGPAATAFAADNYNPPSQIPTNAQCGTGAASGSFGAFGKGNNFAGGANGPLTGDNNSDVCGQSRR
jgi:hypothetical protein